MSGVMWVDPEALRVRGAAFREVGEEIRQAVSQLRAVVSAQGRWWGDDESGAAFGQTYAPDVEKAIAALHELAAALQGFGAQVSGVSDRVVTVDRALGQQIQNTTAASHFDRPWSSADLVPGASGNQSAAATPVLTPDDPAGPSSAVADQGSPVDSGGMDRVPVDGGRSDPVAHRDRSAPAEEKSDSAGESPGAARANPADGPTDLDEAEGGGVGPTRSDQPAWARGRGPEAGARSAGGQPAGQGGPGSAPDRNTGAAPGGPRAAARPPAVAAAGDRTPPGTPWSGNPDPSAPPPGRPSAPARRDDGKPVADNRSTSPRNPSEGRPRPVAAGSTAGPRPGSGPARIARGLADRHGVVVSGFDKPGLDEAVVGEFLAAVDDVLTRYPVIDLRSVGCGEVDGDSPVRVGQLERDPAGEHSPSEWAVVLDGELAANPDALAEILRRQCRPGAAVPGTESRAVYAVTVREFGRAIDRAGDRRARGVAQRTLIAEYLSGGAADEMSFGQVVAGYRRWRDQLSGSGFDRGVLAPADALADAFTDVMLNDGKASEPAKTLCRLLIDTAEAAARPRAASEGGHR
ncbi:WXG100 family type VII secretion target [Nocardia wallacei]|uniref:WXG100 family type VII secretion target n=1 Tax=Nocardia wallacei TaxID=480035 RepID=UPI002455ECBD|nr:hypothetical protein [Nocardia wallacei]